MQFKYPELLWALSLLLIPVFIHLFQLRKFKKTPFTNVQMLQKVIKETRNTRNLKKWLLLFTRLFLFAAIILAFAQPYFAQKGAFKKQETVIYLDNSFSMQAKKNGTSLLESGIQELVKNIGNAKTFSLFTNNEVYRNTELKNVRNDLLMLKYATNQLLLPEITLKANTFFSKENDTEKNLILISDFQQLIGNLALDSTNNINTHIVRLQPDNTKNVLIDSAYISKTDAQNTELTALISSNGITENTPVSLFNAKTLIAKTSAVFGKNNKASVVFSLPKNKDIEGEIKIADKGLDYDNSLYFNSGLKEKIKTLIISEKVSEKYLERIFTNDEFIVNKNNYKSINYSELGNNNIIVLNELKSISTPLATALKVFVANGGNLVVIPSRLIDQSSYNLLLGNYFSTNIFSETNRERKITKINFSHPLYKNVFEKKIANFQYPTVKSHYYIKTTAPALLSFEEGSPFLIGNNGVYLFTASLSKENSNFTGSPLIVPTLYNMGSNSLKSTNIYHTIGSAANIDVTATASAKNGILKIKNQETEFVPLQQSFTNKTRLAFIENPTKSGNYTIVDNTNEVGKISFNHKKSESALVYTPLNNIDATTKNSTISSLFQNLEKDRTVNAIWKWFVILALIFVVTEVLIQKFVK